jgi:hypothetical protein
MKGVKMVLCQLRPYNSITAVPETCGEIPGHYLESLLAIIS